MRRLSDIVHNYKDVILLYIVILLNETILRFNTGLDFSKKALLYNALLITVISLVLININKKVRKYIGLVICIVITIYSFAQNFHYYFFGTFFSFTKLTIMSELGDVLMELTSRFKADLLLYIIPLLGYILYLIFEKDKNVKYKFSFIRLIVSLIFIVIIVFVYIKINELSEDEKNDYNNTSDQYLYQTMSNKVLFENRFGTLSFIERDIAIIINKSSSSLTKEQANQIEEYIKNTKYENNEYTGIFKGKNLIMIQAESLSPFAIDEQLTPTLYKLSKEGLYFENFYSPLYPSNTADSEFIVLTSMVPSLYNGTTFKTFSKNYYPYSMPSLFTKAGYKVNSYHSNDKTFYNREMMHESLGVRYFYDRNDLKLATFEGFNDDYNWIDDKDLFEAAIKNTDIDSNFFDFIITGSGHMPYGDMREELFSNVGIVESINTNIPTDIAYYLASQMKVDQALESLLKILEEKKILDDTVIVIYGDHYPYGLDGNQLKEYAIRGDYDFTVNKTPLIIYNPKIEGKKINTLSSTFDVLPTIANMFSLDLSKAFIVGKDIFSNHNHRVIFADGSILTDNYYYSTSGSGVNSIGDYDANEDIKEVNEIIELSQIVLKSDYYRKR